MLIKRQIKAIMSLPFVVVLIIPSILLAISAGTDHRWENTAVWYGPLFLAGMIAIISGLIMMSITIYLFTTEGKGTLAPWDPTQKLIVTGPYRYVRNPMISGVVAILLGEVLMTGSSVLFSFLLLFVALKTLYFIFDEEPTLVKRFGESYLAYKQNVPRWIPRLTPWVPDSIQPQNLLAIQNHQL